MSNSSNSSSVDISNTVDVILVNSSALNDNNDTMGLGGSSVVVEKIHDPNADYPAWVNIGVPVFAIALFVLVLVLVFIFPNRDAEETIIERMFPEKGAKTRRRRRARTNSQRLEEQEV